MKVYTFIFTIGFLNLALTFLGIPTIYKNYATIALAVITLGYALIVRAVEKEKESRFATVPKYENPHEEIKQPSQRIEDVVEMTQHKEKIVEKVVVSDVSPKKRGRKPKVKTFE